MQLNSQWELLGNSSSLWKDTMTLEVPYLELCGPRGNHRWQNLWTTPTIHGRPWRLTCPGVWRCWTKVNPLALEFSPCSRNNAFSSLTMPLVIGWVCFCFFLLAAKGTLNDKLPKPHHAGRSFYLVWHSLFLTFWELRKSTVLFSIITIDCLYHPLTLQSHFKQAVSSFSGWKHKVLKWLSVLGFGNWWILIMVLPLT